MSKHTSNTKTPFVDLCSFETGEDFTDEGEETDSETDSEVETSVPVKNPRKNGDNLNSLYDRWVAATSEDKEPLTALLLADVRDFALRVIKIKSPRNAASEDIAQAATLKIWLVLDDAAELRELKARLETWFNVDWIGEFTVIKFSSWVYTVVANTLIDFVRQDVQRNEVGILEWKDYSQARSSKTRPTTSSTSLGSASATSKSGNSESLVEKSHKEASEDGFNAEIDVESAIRKLSRRDQELVYLACEGYSDKELAKRFKCTPQQIHNRLNHIQVLLHHELNHFATTLHTCRANPESQYEIGAGLYITDDENKSYRALPEKCKCRKQLTRLESRKLIETGEVQHVFKAKNGKPVNDSSTVWAAQAVRVPRVGLTSKAHVERAVIGKNRTQQTDIEIAHGMSVEALRVLIVPFRPDPWEGRVRFTSWADQQTKGGHKDAEYESDDRRPADPAVPRPIDPDMPPEHRRCPKCCKTNLTVSDYPDRAVRHDCPCGYLGVWKPARKILGIPPSQENERNIENFENQVISMPVSAVLVMKQRTASDAVNVAI